MTLLELLKQWFAIAADDLEVAGSCLKNQEIYSFCMTKIKGLKS